jgi:hypothetical protein
MPWQDLYASRDVHRRPKLLVRRVVEGPIFLRSSARLTRPRAANTFILITTQNGAD